MTVTLFCAVVGVGSVFPVDIDLSRTVGHLKKKIKEEKPGLIYFDADLLKLYLAREGDTWLNLQDDELEKLKDGEISDRIKNLMRRELLLKETRNLNNDAYFSKTFERAEDDIHVLVELPKDVVGGARDDSRLARIEQKVDHLYEKSTTEVYNLSKISSTKGRELRQQLHILLVDVKTVPVLVGASRLVEQFEWESVKTKLGQDIKLTEEQHCKPYLAYVERNIGAVLSKENLCVLGVEHQNLLHVKIPGHNIKLSGRTDLLILSDDVKKHPHRLEELPDVRMLIEVKQEMKGGASSQTISELIALDLMTAAPVMALLTDLKKTWQFFWVSEKSNDSIIIHTAVIEKPGDAFEVIRTLLLQPPSVDADIQFACFERPIKRRKLAYMLHMVSESGEDVDIRDAIERYYDIASVLGPDIQMARAVASQITRAIPAFSSPSLSYFS